MNSKHLWANSTCLFEPVVIPCGYSVCKRHLDKLLENLSRGQNTFKCELCYEEHFIPGNGFQVSKQIQNVLDIGFNELKIEIGVFAECKKTFEETRETVVKLDSLCKDPQSYIYEYFHEIKRQVDLRREELKQQIDQFSDEVL